MDAKSKGGKVKKRPNWERIKVDVMLQVVRSKFDRDINLQEKLLATQNQQIVEGHTGDKFWGGKANHLGNILMRIREEVRTKHQQTNVSVIVVDEPEEASSKCKPRCKGNCDRQTLFQDKLQAWEISDGSEGSDQGAGSGDVDVASNVGQDLLPNAFVAWLRFALTREVSAVDTESLICSMEVVLGTLLEDPSEDPSAVLHSAADMLSAEGARLTAAELSIGWALHVIRS